jgi:hypothetical protein
MAAFQLDAEPDPFRFLHRLSQSGQRGLFKVKNLARKGLNGRRDIKYSLIFNKNMNLSQ